MAIAISRPGAVVASTSNLTAYSFASFLTSPGAMYLVMVFATGTVAAGSMSDTNGLTWNRELSFTYGSGVNTCYLFWSPGSEDGAFTTVTFDCTGDAATGCVMCLCQITGHNATIANPIRQTKTGTGVNSIPTLTLTQSMNTNNGVFAGLGIGLVSSGATPMSGWTTAADAGYSTPNASGFEAYRAGGATGTAIDYGYLDAPIGSWGGIFAEVYEAGQPIIEDGQGDEGKYGDLNFMAIL